MYVVKFEKSPSLFLKLVNYGQFYLLMTVPAAADVAPGDPLDLSPVKIRTPQLGTHLERNINKVVTTFSKHATLVETIMSKLSST